MRRYTKAEPLKLTICALSQGPQLGFSMEPSDPESQWAPALDFGKVTVLSEMERTMYVTNRSLIPAEMKTFIGGTDSAFQAGRCRLIPGRPVSTAG